MKTVLEGEWKAMADYAGGVGQLAKALGVTRLTIHRWGTGKRTPPDVTVEAVNLWARKRGLKAPWDVKPKAKE